MIASQAKHGIHPRPIQTVHIGDVIKDVTDIVQQLQDIRDGGVDHAPFGVCKINQPARKPGLTLGFFRFHLLFPLVRRRGASPRPSPGTPHQTAQTPERGTRP